MQIKNIIQWLIIFFLLHSRQVRWVFKLFYSYPKPKHDKVYFCNMKKLEISRLCFLNSLQIVNQKISSHAICDSNAWFLCFWNIWRSQAQEDFHFVLRSAISNIWTTFNFAIFKLAHQCGTPTFNQCDQMKTKLNLF